MKNHKPHLRSILLFISTLITSNLALASPLTSETFQDAPVGNVTSAIGTWVPSGQNVANGSHITVHTDSNNLFGKGTDYQFLEISKNTTVQTGALNFTSEDSFTPNSVVTISFLYYEPTNTGNTGFMIYFGKGQPGGSNLAGFIGLQNGTLYGQGGINGTNTVDYDIATPLRFDIVVNNSTSDYNYDSQTLAGQQFDVWIDGTLALSNARFSTTGNSYDGDMSSIRMIISSGNNQQQTAYIGEIGVFAGGEVGSPIPEPSTTVGLLGVLVFCAVLGKRQMRLKA